MPPALPDSPAHASVESQIRECVLRLAAVAQAQGHAHLFRVRQLASPGFRLSAPESFFRTELASRESCVPAAWFKLDTEHRLSWVRDLGGLLQALAGMPVSVSSCSTWRWSCEPGRARPRYVPGYGILVCTEARKPFEPKDLARTMLSQVCAVDHPLADRSLFEWQDEQREQPLFRGYRWTPSGFVASFETKTAALEAIETLFAGFQTELTRTADDQGVWWYVQVHLPESAAVAAG